MKTARTFCISILLLVAVPAGLTAQDAGVRFRLGGVSLRASLDSLMRWYPVSILYLDRDVEGRTVSAACSECTIEEALERVLSGTPLFWMRQGNQYILRMRQPKQAALARTVSGTVRDSLTGSPLPGATVIVQDAADPDFGSVTRWCPANAFGFFSFRGMPEGRYVLAVRALGYETAFIPLDTAQEAPCDVRLAPREITLQEITVEGDPGSMSPAEGITHGVYIRSVPSDRNLYRLDGERIYNPSHFGGVLSPFNEESLGDVRTAIGGLPPEYGGEIGGILDLSLRTGAMGKVSGTAGTGSLGTHLSLDAPLTRSTTLFASARRTYPDAAIPSLSSAGIPSRLGSFESTARLTGRLSASGTVSLSGYIGRDRYSNAITDAVGQLSNDFFWGNSMLNLRWFAIASPTLFLHASAGYTRYDLTMGDFLSGDPAAPGGLRIASDYTIEDITLRASAEHYYDEEHTLRAGIEIIHHRMGGFIDAALTQIAPMSFSGTSSWESAVFLQDRWLVLPRVMAEIGVRATSFAGSGGSFSAFDPRFSLLVSLDVRTRLYASMSAINQFIQPYNNSGLFVYYPGIFWYPATDDVRPSSSLQWTLGIEKTLRDDAVVVSLEAFYRTTHNLHEFVKDAGVPPVGDLNQAVILGTGNTYGLDASIQKRVGAVTGSACYSLAWAFQRFAELNGGDPFVPRFDRRHELHLEIAWAPSDHWTFGLLCVLASDLTQSSPEKVTGTRFTGTKLGAASSPPAEIMDINGSRIPGFQRLELNAAASFTLWGLPSLWSLRLLNAYGLLDPFAWELKSSPDIRSRWEITLREIRLFPLYPSLGLTVRF